MTSSRRGFFKAASATAAALAAASRLRAWAAPGPVRIWGTFRDRQHAAGDTLTWKPVTEIASDAIALDPLTTRQEMLGFGAAMTDASCWMFNQMAEEPRAAIMNELFAPGEMAFNVCRCCTGSSDYAHSMYNFDDGPEDDPELKRFSIDHDKAYIIPLLKTARKLNPELFLFSSPWSPPPWMKFNRSMLGGTIKKTTLEPYSRYIGKYLDGYAAEGVPFNAVTVQNEVDTTVDGRYPACLWSQEDEILFVGRYLGPLLRKANSPTKIWILDHNFNLWGRAIAELSDPGVYEYADGIAWHGYAGEPSGMSMAHNAFPEKNAYFTEGGPGRMPGAAAFGPASSWTTWAEWANDCVRNWAKSITVWNIALDEHGTPYIGRRETPPAGAAGAAGRGGAAGAAAAGGRGGAAGAAAAGGRGGAAGAAGAGGRGGAAGAAGRGGAAGGGGGGGVITIQSDTHAVSRSARFWAMAHYSKHIKRGAKVFRTDGMGDNATQNFRSPVSHAGFINPDGSMVVVLSNRGPEKRVQLVLGGNALDIDLPADSVHTLQWS